MSPSKLNAFWKKLQFWKKSRVIKSGRSVPYWISTFKYWVYGSALVALVFLVFEAGLRWQLPGTLSVISIIIDYIVFVLFFLDMVFSFVFTYPKSEFLKNNWLDLVVFVPFVLRILPVQSSVGLIIIRHILVLIKVFTRTRKFSRVLRNVRINTAQIVAFSFLITIFIGMILLTFPTATADGRGASLIDAFFTATSATCVTGLIVQDTPSYFSEFGQWVILILIQLGGLGIMTYSAFVALLLKKFSLGQRKMVEEMFDEEKNVYSMIFYIVKMTFFVELAGIVLLFVRWIFVFKDPAQTLYYSIFHAISAFCNAGFSLFSDSLEGFTGDVWVNFIIMLLIILGGLGFIVIFETSGQLRRQKVRLSTHSSIVLLTSGILIVLGFILFFFFEFDRSLLHYPLPTRFLAALFQSVTTRTAGFNTIPIGQLSRESLTFMILLMFIGASPGSTGGGIKTTTFAVLLVSVYSILRGRDHVVFFRRNIILSSILKALALFVFALFLVMTVFSLLLATEDIPYLQLLFETVSAFGTVGLSTGITASLSTTGKLFIILLMYAGRIGPLTLGLALAQEMKKIKIEYPDARVMIG